MTRRSFRDLVPQARISFRGDDASRSVGIYGTTDLGIPAVEIAGDLEGMSRMTPDQADKIAEGLRLAARAARGEVSPKPPDEFPELAKLRAAMEANRQPVFRGEQYAHPRGWNDALDFVERTLKEVLGEKP